METDKTAVHGVVRVLGYGGLIPFLVFSGLVFIADNEWWPICMLALRAYTACIASFLGAIHWGLVMKSAAPESASFLWGVAPCLLATAGLLLEPPTGLGMITAVLFLCYFVDRASYPRYGFGHWLPMRLTLTAIAGLACISPLVLV